MAATIAIIIGVLVAAYYGAYRYAMSKADNPNQRALIGMMYWNPASWLFLAFVYVMGAWDRVRGWFK